MAERLDAALSRAGIGTRSEVRDLIKSGRVRVGNQVIRAHGFIVKEAIYLDGVLVPERRESATLLVHKSVGLACSHDQKEAPSVFDLIPHDISHLALEAAGRLDRATSGLMILTTDGALIHTLTSPKKHRVKRYRLTYAGDLCAHASERFAKGMLLEGDDRPTLPARLVLDPDHPQSATVYLHEGRYHQVRRMICACGGNVVTLHRDRIGALTLPSDLGLGQTRDITAEELAQLLADPPDAAWTSPGQAPG